MIDRWIWLVNISPKLHLAGGRDDFEPLGEESAATSSGDGTALGAGQGALVPGGTGGSSSEYLLLPLKAPPQ